MNELNRHYMDRIVEQIEKNVLKTCEMFSRQIDEAMEKDVLDTSDLNRIVETSRSIIRLMTVIWRCQHRDEKTEYVNHVVSIPKDQKE